MKINQSIKNLNKKFRLQDNYNLRKIYPYKRKGKKKNR